MHVLPVQRRASRQLECEFQYARYFDWLIVQHRGPEFPLTSRFQRSLPQQRMATQHLRCNHVALLVNHDLNFNDAFNAGATSNRRVCSRHLTDRVA